MMKTKLATVFLSTLCALSLSYQVIAEPSSSATMRLISSDASATELIFALGIDEYLVGVDVTSELPKDYRELPNIGYHRNLSAEGLLSLQPTAVIGSEHIGPAAVTTALHAANIQLVQLPSASNGVELRQNIGSLATALNLSVLGEQLQNQLDQQLQSLQQIKLTQPISTAFLLTMDTGNLRLAGKDSGGDALIKLMGCHNVASFNNYQTVSTESLLALEPELIIVAGLDANTAVATLLQANPALSYSPAGKQQKIFAIDSKVLVAGLSLAAIDEALRLKQLVSTVK
jgi:iron complex transport system substrate-binding protein